MMSSSFGELKLWIAKELHDPVIDRVDALLCVRGHGARAADRHLALAWIER
jgi:hypothetical protein